MEEEAEEGVAPAKESGLGDSIRWVGATRGVTGFFTFSGGRVCD